MKLDNYEKDILDGVENGEWESTNNTKEVESNILNILKHQKKKSISIRLPENDIYEVKKKGLELGIPYQNLIQTLVHQYIQGKVKISL
jgi:predicted DNA binding CopG/RHH family protein